VGGWQWRHDDKFAGGQGVLSLFTSNSVLLQYLNTGYGYGVLTWQRKVEASAGWRFSEGMAGVQGVLSLHFRTFGFLVISYLLSTQICT
jgi:hypothetical protein